ncbi:MAG: Nucleoside recognition protein [uncultured bacterium]|nr:MAG: Nucleoside recognition protein [uncultured bacterium]HBH17526.1 nucleoside recognition protein [Cyanobacteria bacterium UBA9579]
MLGYIWLFFIVTAVVLGGINGRIDAVTQAAMDSAKLAVDISISLIGVMSLWLGIMKLAEASGLINILSKLIKPVTKRLFPQVPPDHPSIGNIAMNFSANALGLTNAATPIGIKAMKELQKLNPNKDTASNAMCTFLAMNTAGFQLVPATIIAVLLAAGSKNPTIIIGPTLIATSVALITAITVVKILEKIPYFQIKPSLESVSSSLINKAEAE